MYYISIDNCCSIAVVIVCCSTTIVVIVCWIVFCTWYYSSSDTFLNYSKQKWRPTLPESLSYEL